MEQSKDKLKADVSLPTPSLPRRSTKSPKSSRPLYPKSPGLSVCRKPYLGTLFMKTGLRPKGRGWLYRTYDWDGLTGSKFLSIIN